VSYARNERAALCALLDETGPDAPTLCAGWCTRDLAAHLVLRERHPVAAAGIMGGPLAGRTRRAQAALAGQVPYAELVGQLKSGPPRLSLFGLPGADGRLNLAEFFVHHEDVRRAGNGWQPRELSEGLAEALWHRLRGAGVFFRRVPVGIELARDDVPAVPGRRRVRMTARARTPMVTVSGHPGELLLWVFGRTSAARVRLDGSDADVRKLTESSWQV
jgi:uncharacterized protein (TIGR03085 family)